MLLELYHGCNGNNILQQSRNVRRQSHNGTQQEKMAGYQPFDPTNS
jgi:hypothetical protein